MKKLIIVTLLMFVLLLILPSAFAQTVPDSGNSQLYNAANGTNQNPPVNRPNNSNGNQPNQNNGVMLGSGINLLWLLPLLAIPLVFIIFRMGESTGQNTRETYNPQLAGAKGGKTTRLKKSTSKKTKPKK